MLSITLNFVFGETDYPTDPFDMPRQSKDETHNRFGISLLDICCSCNMHVLNGRMFDDKNEEITCISNNGRSVVDYMFASTSLFNSILHFQISSEDFSIIFHYIVHLSCPEQSSVLSHLKISVMKIIGQDLKWNEDLKNNFVECFSTIFSNFKDKVARENRPALSYLTEFIKIFKTAGKCMRVKNKKVLSKCSKKTAIMVG